MFIIIQKPPPEVRKDLRFNPKNTNYGSKQRIIVIKRGIIIRAIYSPPRVVCHYLTANLNPERKNIRRHPR